MELVACLFCGGSETTIKLVQRDLYMKSEQMETFSAVVCTKCELIFLSPRPSRSEIPAYYPAEYYPAAETPRKSKVRFSKRLLRLMKKWIREEFYGYPGEKASGLFRVFRRLTLYPKHWHLRFTGYDIIPFKGDGRILDVGCGPGWLLRDLRDQGWEVYGVDFSPFAVEYARNRGLNVKCGDLLDAAYKDGFFDTVLFNHSLEHVYDPIKTMEEVRRILKPGGLVYIIIPNACSFEASLFGKWWVGWDVPRHLFHFNKKTIATLLDKTGFRLLQIRDGLTRSHFLGSLDNVNKHVFRHERKHGFLVRRLASWVCFVAGHLGSGSEMKVLAQRI